MIRSKLFEVFPKISTDEWVNKIKTDLKGKDYTKKLVWNCIEGYSVEPFYRKEDLSNLSYLDVYPNEFPYIRGNKSNENSWEIREDIRVVDVKEANLQALDILNKGVTSLGFIVDENMFNSQEDFSLLLKDIFIENIELNFICDKDSSVLLTLLDDEIRLRNLNSKKINASVDFDPLGYLTINGKLPFEEYEIFNHLSYLANYTISKLPKTRLINVHAEHFRNAGSNIVQELAFGISMGIDYVASLVKNKIPADNAASLMKFSFGVGSDYFTEIAKLRAARFIWAKIIESYGINNKESAKMIIHTNTIDWNKTSYDNHANILRTTTEAMSAILGGTNSLSVKPFDFIVESPNKKSTRIARNIQLILKEEANFDKVVDPSSGSYYIENITDKIITDVWDLILKVEDKGGYLKAFKSGFIQAKIESISNIRKKNVANRNKILLGTNRFPNNEEIFTKEQINFVEKKQNNINEKDIIVKPLIRYRAAETFEQLRFKTNVLKNRPKVFLLTYGNLTMRKAREEFASNFFSCAGFEIIMNNDFNTIDEGIDASISAHADIVVFCSSDDEYAEISQEMISKLPNNVAKVVAGNPIKSIDNLKSYGVDYFINMNTDLLDVFNKMFLTLDVCSKN